MTSHRITVKIDPTWVEHFRETKMNLCSAFSVTTNYSDMQYNVIATSEEPTPLNTITWIEEYSIAACKKSPSINSYVFSSTSPLKVEAGNAFTVSDDWKTNVPGHNALAPKKGFLFISEPPSAALLYQRVLNARTPIYLTSFGGITPPPGQHTLLPTGKMMIFFATQEAGTSFRVDGISTKAFEFQTQEKTNAFAVAYNKGGLWEIEGPASTGGGDALARETKL